MTITCGIEPTGVATMAMNVLHNTCNMCIGDLPDMYVCLQPLGLWPSAYILGKSLMPMVQLAT